MKKLTIILLLGLTLFHNEVLAQRDKEANKNAVAARRALKAGDYLESIDYSVKALKGEPNKRNQRLLGEALAEATDSFYNQLSRMIVDLSDDDTPLQWTKENLRKKRALADWYQNGNLAKSYLTQLTSAELKELKVNEALIKDFTNELESTKSLFKEGLKSFGEAQKALAAELMEEDTKVAAYRAYKHLADVQEFDPQNNELLGLMGTAKERATIHLAFLEFAAGFIDRQSYVGNISDFSTLSSFDYHSKQVKSIYGSFMNVRVVQDQDNLWLNKDNPQVIAGFCAKHGLDAVVFGSLDRPQFNYLDDKPVSREIEKEITISESKVKKADGTEETVKQTAKVKATRISYSRQNRGSIVGKVFLYDAINQRFIIQDQASQGEYLVSQSWENGTGDLRAFSERERKSFTATPLPRTPEPEIQVGAIGDLAKKVVSQTYSWIGKLYE
jgi:hypothetical protein